MENVGKLMLDDSITELINDYDSSIFNKEQNTDKIKYIKESINEEKEKTDPDQHKIKVYEQLLEKAITAEEVRILGKILKINQGLPTNTADTYRYIKSIEKFVERQYNKALQDPVDETLSKLVNAIAIENDEEIYYLSRQYKKLKAKRDANWEKFDLIKFILDPIYKQEQIDKYEQFKVNFNILEVIAEVPHFREMFNVLALNKQILNSLSIRNRFEDIVLNESVHRSKSGKQSTNISKVLSKDEVFQIKDAVDQHLINSWIIAKNFSITIPAGVNNNPAPEILRLDNNANIDQFRQYVENYAIPLLKEKLPDNKFISLLTFGLKQGIPFYKLPFNMVQIDNTQKTRSLYEDALYAFNNLKTIKINDIDMNLVDMFYLYNLIVNRDKFGPNSLTRIFEDLIAAEDGNKLLVYDFNSWIDKQDVRRLLETFESPDLSNDWKESTPVIEDNDIGFKEQPTESDLEEAANENGTNLEDDTFAEQWSKKEGWSVDYFNKHVKPKLNEAWQIEFKLADDQESPAPLISNMAFNYKGLQRSDVLAQNTVDAIILGEKTATTRYESEGNLDDWQQLKVGDRLRFKGGTKYVVIEVTKPLTKLVQNQQLRLSLDFSSNNQKFTSHSGGAEGSDTYWSEYGKQFGVVTNNYYAQNQKTQNGNIEISQNDLEEGIEKIRKANETLHRKPEKYIEFLAKNWPQVKYSNAIYAISTIDNGLVSGGTAWAVQMAIDAGKPVFVFDQSKNTWFKYQDGKWVKTDVPTLIENFAGIGTRKINENGERAIKDVYKKTFKTNVQQHVAKSPSYVSSYYKTEPSVESKLIALVKAANMKGLHLVYDSDLINEELSIRNAKGFVRNGEIYINADRATDDTVIHEFGHLYLADAKLNNSDKYYNLLAKVRNTQTWKQLRSLQEYANKRGSDFDEEVLAHLISNSQKFGGGPDYDLVLEALDLVSQDYKDLLKSDILPVLSDTFISNYKEQQKLATVKNKLMEDDIIKENCE